MVSVMDPGDPLPFSQSAAIIDHRAQQGVLAIVDGLQLVGQVECVPLFVPLDLEESPAQR